jgi:hypothetical protein
VGALASVEQFDLLSETWGVITGTLNIPRTNHTATVLNDGRVLVVGGCNGDPRQVAPNLGVTDAGALDSAELFDPASKRWTLVTDTLQYRRENHSALKLNDGRVMIIGGNGHEGIGHTEGEIFDPATLSWSLTRPMSVTRPAVVVLLDGRVLAARV